MHIEKNVPIPRRGKYIDLLQNMEPGDSVFVPCEDRKRLQNLISNTAQYYRKRWNPATLWTVKLVDGGVRIWRTQ